MTKTEEDAVAKKRSEAAKKAAATRARNAEEERQQQEQLEGDQHTPENDPPQEGDGPSVNERSDMTGRPQEVPRSQQKNGLSANDIIELKNHRADVYPGDQQGQHEQRQHELAVERAVHGVRTEGGTITEPDLSEDSDVEAFDAKAGRASWGRFFRNKKN